MDRNPVLPHLSRVDFYRLREEDLVFALASAIEIHANEDTASELTKDHDALVAWGRVLVDVPNGGFTQFFFNHRGDHGVESVADLLDRLKVPKAGPLLREAAAIYHQHRSRFQVDNPWDGLFGSIEEFDRIDNGFSGVVLRANRALDRWIRSNITKLAAGENGEPINSRFTGSVEIKQPNGLVGQYLDVKRGKPSGAYREFFEDGSVRKVVLYKAGEVSGDFWPNGQLRKKESKRWFRTIIEWFFPSGRLQKRFVKDKSGYAVDPVRLFHENGQLAEELTLVQGHKCGPWLKFFDDGSPQLQAEYASDEDLIVHNAWDSNRRQVVKNGSGTFHDDGRRIDYEYSVFFESDWADVSQLEGGMPHGKVTRFFHGVLWNISFYRKGVQDGESTSYWDNGRVRSITDYIHGEAGERKSFPKFDQPVPAVLLSVEANEELYTAWCHIPVDEYPCALNLDEVREQLQVPDFLREVHERNLANALKSDYEDASTFNDSIAYSLTVGETGEVSMARANGGGVYSGGHWDTYVPLLRQLRFTPGRIRGRAVECRVLAKVDHTFVEGKTIGSI